MPLPAEEFKVFISHATAEDGNLVYWMANALDRLHIRAYVYERYYMGGRNRFELIKDMVKECPYFLVLLTKDGIRSQWVNQEIGYAVAMGKNPIPIVEVDNSTNKRIDSKGFIELHDPINYYVNNKIQLMADVIYALRNYLGFEGKWKDLIYLSCECGHEGDGELKFDMWWEKWTNDPHRTPIKITWDCANCHKKITASFPDCQLLPQEH